MHGCPNGVGAGFPVVFEDFGPSFVGDVVQEDLVEVELVRTPGFSVGSLTLGSGDFEPLPGRFIGQRNHGVDQHNAGYGGTLADHRRGETALGLRHEHDLVVLADRLVGVGGVLR